MIRKTFCLLCGLAAYLAGNASGEGQRFVLSGRIQNLQAGDTLRFERIVLPGWSLEKAFDVVAEAPDTFRYEGVQAHEQYYLMTYLPRMGRAKACDRRGKTLILTADEIELEGTADEIYYSALKGGIYREPQLAELLAVEDSLGRIRGRYFRLAQESLEKKDTIAALDWERKFNLFNEDNPGRERSRALRKAYREARPEGNLYLAVDMLESLSFSPLEEIRVAYEKFSPELKDGYYGQEIARGMAALERLAPGRPAPAFSLASVDGRTLTLDDFKGGYLLIYHWGMCPGSIALDGRVQALYDRYKDRGLRVLGLTESIATIRKVYEGLPADRETPGPGVKDIRPVLAGMLRHPWIEVELETGFPENKAVMRDYDIGGWPFFVLVNLEGKLEVRDYFAGFFQAKEILDRELGDRAGQAKP